MGKLENKKEIVIMMIMCTVLYFVSYITRINYSAVMVEMADKGDVSKDIATLAVTINGIAYGAGQLLSGFLGDKIKPYKLIFAGLLATATINILIPFNTAAFANIVLWTANGLAQAFMWPPLVRIMTTYFDEMNYKTACGFVAGGSGTATLLMYLLAPVIISAFGWRNVFFIPAAIAILFAIVWIAYFHVMGKRVSWELPVNKIQNENATESEKKVGGGAVFLLGMVMLGIVFQGILRDGITNWMPTYIKETFKVDSEIAILSGVVLPVFHIICNHLALTVNRKWIKNEIMCTGSFFIVGSAALGVLVLTNADGGIFLTIAMFAFAVGAMHGINVILTCLVPNYFAKYGKVSLMSGLLNSCTYVGAAIATYGSSVLSRELGWGFTVIMWAVTAVCGMAVCFGAAKKWNRFKMEN